LLSKSLVLSWKLLLLWGFWNIQSFTYSWLLTKSNKTLQHTMGTLEFFLRFGLMIWSTLEVLLMSPKQLWWAKRHKNKKKHSPKRLGTCTYVIAFVEQFVMQYNVLSMGPTTLELEMLEGWHLNGNNNNNNNKILI
jgi:hypothetical protein